MYVHIYNIEFSISIYFFLETISRKFDSDWGMK